MAKMIDQKPSYHGEAKVWSGLQEFLPDNVIVYNNREINGREFDFCLLIEDCGIVIIEAKGWLSDKIDVRGVDNIIVEGFDKPQRSPKKQARAYRFALLNKIAEKYSVSPLVFDMVCYPFITKAEYKTSRLDIITEEQFTIFKEDLESQELLQKKLQDAYELSKAIPHGDFSRDLVLQIRQEWEPDLGQYFQHTQIKVKPYSIMSILPDEVKNDDIMQIVDEYFNGIKRIVFLSRKSDYEALTNAFNASFKIHNIEPSGNSLQVRYDSGLRIGTVSARAFNLEIYNVPNLRNFCKQEISIEEGNLSSGDQKIVEELASITTFNYQQYLVEHASTENNVLVEAGAGTGKTYSMVSRVAFLCNKKLNAVTSISEEIAMVTFTNEAANNMKVRMKQMFLNYFILTSNSKFIRFIEDIDRAHISTIHSFSIEILRNESLYTGLGENFRISSNEYLRGKIYDIYLSKFFEEMELRNPNFVNEIPVPVYDLKKKTIGIADRLLSKSIDLRTIKPSELGVIVEDTLPYFNEIITKVLIPAENEYLETVHITNKMDLKECIILLGRILDQINGKLDFLKIRYLFIDEFQDTDDVQIKVFQKFQKVINADCRLFVVGDLKQSIYRFRGAKLSAFTYLKSGTLFDWDTYHLKINYRTDRRLLDLYDTIFSNMGSQNYLPYSSATDRLSSTLIMDVDDSNLLVPIPCHAKDEEKFFESLFDVVKKQEAITATLMHSKKLSDEERTIAILVRSNWQVDKIVTAAKKKCIRIDTKSGGDLYQLESTIDLYKLVLALMNSSNLVYLVNFIESNYTTLSLDFQKYNGMSEQECLSDLKRVLDEFFSIRMGKSWQQVINEAYTLPILYVLRQLYSALAPWKQYSDRNTDQKYYMTNYDYLLERIVKYSRVDTLTLNQIAEYLKVNILTGQKQLARELDVEDEGIHILCTTIHKSKGLEYGTVILPYTDEDISDIHKVKLDANYSESKLSYTIMFENKVRERNSYYNETVEVDEQISEESRILYVALTRAIRNCIWIKNLDKNPHVCWGSLLEG